MNRPRIAITMGDASGVGPEIIMKALAHDDVAQRCRPIVVGDADRLRAADRICGTSLAVRDLTREAIATTKDQSRVVDCIDLRLIPIDLPWGRLSAKAGD